MIQLKEITITHIHEFKLYFLFLSFFLLFLFLICFEYTREFTSSFFFIFYSLNFVIYLYYTLNLLHLINSLRTKIKKKNLNKTCAAKLDNNWNLI